MFQKLPLFVLYASLSLALPALIGCPSAVTAEAQVLLQQGLSALTQNREIVEQSVSDVKSALSPSDPRYLDAMESYGEAKESYDRFLESVESGDKTPHTRSVRGRTATDVQDKTIAFLKDASRALAPNANTRKIPYERAVIVPDGLSAQVNRLPKRVREQLLDEFDRDVRWRRWGDL